MPTNERSVTGRWILALAPLALATTVPAALVAALRHRLPDHAYGAAPGSPSWTAVVVWPAVGTALLAVVVVWFLLGHPRPVDRLAGVAVLAWPGAAATLGYVVVLVSRNLDRPGPVPGPVPWWVQSPFAEIGILALAALVWVLARRSPVPPDAVGRPDPSAPRLPLAAGARAEREGEFAARRYGAVDLDDAFGYRARSGSDLLALSLTDGREFVVTVDDAGTAAALVNTLLDRRREGRGADHDRSDVQRPAG